jgi:tRNA pseudouridine38-40 synthase
MRIVRLLIAFDGTGYCGWQRQKNGPSIQETIERALSIICNEAVILHGAGRTDAGVHAEGMSAHFQTNSTIDSTALKRGLNALLPGAIRIISLADAAADFHARFSAQAKTYRYTVFSGEVMDPQRRLYAHHLPFRLCHDTMRECLQRLTGEHDFSSFETTGSRDKDRNGRGAVRTIFNARLNGPEEDYLQFFLTGDGFLRHMVRNLIGTILEVGKGKRTVQEFVDILGYRDRNRAAATAPSRGLCLIKVHYERDWNSG